MNRSPSRNRTSVQQSFRLRADALGARIVRGASYQFLGIAVRTATTVGSVAILARLLEPADFGYLAMATVMTEFAALFSNFGFTNILIQRSRISRLHLDTVFWASLATGIILTILVFLTSLAATAFYAEPIVGQLLRILCLSFVLGSLSSVPWAILSRLMYFRAQFIVQSVAKLSGALVAVVLALLGYGVWSLALGGLAGVIANVLASYMIIPYRPRLRFDAPYIKSTWQTSGSYFAGGFLYYCNMNVDLLLIGRFLGAAPLGFYQNARSLTDEIRARIAMPLQHVLFPAFSSLQNDTRRFQDIVIRSTRILALIVVPIGFGVSAVAPELVPVLYGEKWNSMIPVMSMFGISAALRASTAVASPLFNSQDRVALGLRYSFINTILSMGGIFIALSGGVNYVSMAVAAASIYALVTLKAAIGLIGLGLRDLIRMLATPFIASMIMWILIFFLRRLGYGFFDETKWISFALLVMSGIVIYVVSVFVLSRQYFYELAAVLKKFR